MNDKPVEVITVTLNPAIDRTLIIPAFSAGNVNRVERQHSKAGGKGVNVAAAIADYGHRVAATGFLGRENGSAFETLFSDKKIDDHFIRLGGETRTGIKIYDPDGGETTDINFPGLTPAPGDLELLFQKLQALTRDAPLWVVLAGSLPPGVEPPVYRDLIQALKKGNCRIMLDTSGEALKHALDAAPNVVKPNVHELEALVGAQLTTDAAIVEAARRLLSRGVELAVVSMGARGALLITSGEVVLAGAPEVKIGSSVGAGDAMVAGIIAGQLGGSSLRDTAKLASAFSLAAIAIDESKAPFRSRIEAWAEKIPVREISSG